MKKILITGVNSYIGNSLAKWLEIDQEKYDIDLISLKDGSWREKDFSIYDVIVHVAGIAHVSRDPKMEEKYYKINRDLTIEIAMKSKEEKVEQFIFLSSIIVYGENIDNNGLIDKNTVPKPSNFYGNSKLQAEKGIQELEDATFNVVIIRPPMIYGRNSRGNYPKLARIAVKIPIFPDIDNQRSMLHIDNLSEFIKLMIDNKESGLFFPQNKEYVKTSDMVSHISEVHGKKIRLVRIFNPLLRVMSTRVDVVNKVFGNLVYAKEMSIYKDNYRIRDFHSSIELTERSD